MKDALAEQAEVDCLREPLADAGFAPYRHDRTLTHVPAATRFDPGLPAVLDLLPDVMSTIGNRV